MLQPTPGAEYDALWRAHRARVVRLCQLLLADADEGEDVGQEVFAKLHRACQAPPDDMLWGPWLTRVAVHACRDRRRSRWWKRWRSATEPLDDDLLAGRGTPEGDAIGAERRARIWDAFRRLPARQQEVFALRHIEEWTTQDVADALGLSTGSVKRHLFRAVHRLRVALGDRS